MRRRGVDSLVVEGAEEVEQQRPGVGEEGVDDVSEVGAQTPEGLREKAEEVEHLLEAAEGAGVAEEWKEGAVALRLTVQVEVGQETMVDPMEVEEEEDPDIH